ncbi:MAG TPA: hypothetical protein VMH83_08215 [Candidatus Acidoferrum sp.]|nr:hypothetical protein [Candidatus Acidoferrum sp.]
MQRVAKILQKVLQLLLWCATVSGAESKPFTVIVIPDTQYYVDFEKQKAGGFAIDSSTLLIEEMQYIASRSVANGGDVAFAAAVGDVWQHMSASEDTGHTRRGIVSSGPDEGLQTLIRPRQLREIEIPQAVEAYRILARSGVPFGIAPGNHDYDAMWAIKLPGTDAPQVHIGGLDNFRRTFGSQSEFFKGKPWYVGAHDGGTNSAQIFEAGGYRFLHLALEFQPGDAVLAWAETVLAAHPGMPTLITTHQFLHPRGDRELRDGMNLALGDPVGNNTPEQVWQKFISRHDQIFMVLSGHHSGQATRIDANVFGHKVYQLLSDYQGRGQAGLDAGQKRYDDGGVPGIGDGWIREMKFLLDGEHPRVEVRTYSTHYHAYADQLATYAVWYKAREQAQVSDDEFVKKDGFVLELDDFAARFGRRKQ